MAFVSGESMLKERFFQALERIQDIPTFPEVVGRLNGVLANPYYTMKQVADAIMEDPAVTARLLKLVNSAYYRRMNSGREIISVSFAVNRVGLDEIRRIVMTLSVFSAF